MVDRSTKDPNKPRRKPKKKKGRKPQPPVRQRTVIVRGEMLDYVEAFHDQQAFDPSFISVLRYFCSLGLVAHENKHGAVIKGKRWEHKVDQDMQDPDVANDPFQVDLEDFLK